MVDNVLWIYLELDGFFFQLTAGALFLGQSYMDNGNIQNSLLVFFWGISTN